MFGTPKSSRKGGMATAPETLVYHEGVFGAPENPPTSAGRWLSRWLDPGYRGPVLGARAALLRRIPLRRVECPCCGGRFARFQSGWGGSIHSCPRCGSHERHRLLWLYLKRRTNLLSNELSVLHWAPEPGLEWNLRALPNLSYATADLDPSRAALQLDITDIDAPSASYDVILCSHVLEHVDDDRRAMRELRRILRPGGWAILLVPIDDSRDETYEDPAIVTPEERLRAYRDADHLRLYGRDFAMRLAGAGFHVTVDRWAETLPAKMIDRHVLSRNESIYVCRKDAQESQRD
jgi:SAM-dependent methyltransferase